MKMDGKHHGVFKKVCRENHALQQAALEGRRRILLREAEDHGQPHDLTNCRPVYMLSLLAHFEVGTGNVRTIDMELKKYQTVQLGGRVACGRVFEVTWFHPRLFHYWEAPPLNPKSHLVMELMPTDLSVYIAGQSAPKRQIIPLMAFAV